MTEFIYNFQVQLQVFLNDTTNQRGILLSLLHCNGCTVLWHWGSWPIWLRFILNHWEHRLAVCAICSAPVPWSWPTNASCVPGYAEFHSVRLWQTDKIHRRLIRIFPQCVNADVEVYSHLLLKWNQICQDGRVCISYPYAKSQVNTSK